MVQAVVFGKLFAIHYFSCSIKKGLIPHSPVFQCFRPLNSAYDNKIPTTPFFFLVLVVFNTGLAGKVLVSGYDGIPLAIEYVKKGKMQNTIDQLPKKQVAVAIESILKKLNKQELPDFYYVDPVVVDKQKAQEY